MKIKKEDIDKFNAGYRGRKPTRVNVIPRSAIDKIRTAKEMGISDKDIKELLR